MRRQLMWQWARSSRGVALLIVVLLWLWRGIVFAQEDEIIAGGKLKYEKYCATCHGHQAKGDGPSAAILTLKPADLTQLRQRNGGQFPFWRAYRMIDGREQVRGHGTRDMPLWGFVFHVEEGARTGPYQDDLVRGRVWQLVYFLESIQE